jgi:actin-like ATPase involved in cell morphogenesis
MTKKLQVKINADKDKMYFTRDTERAIVKFQNYKTISKKKKIFEEKISPSLDRLVDSIIYTYKFNLAMDADELKNDCISFIFENLGKFDVTKRQ